MAQNANRVQDLTSRRRILQGLGALGAASVAGCFGEDDGGPAEVDLDRVEVDPDDIVEGGTLNVGLLLDLDTWDVPNSTAAPATIVHNLFFESLLTNDRQGDPNEWLSQSYELVDTQDTQLGDYEPHMRSAPIENPDDGNPFIDVDEQIVVRHPDNNLQEDDEALVLTVNEVQDAIDEGTYGMHFRHELHEGVEFHNGEELTAEHVVRSYERYEGSLNAGQVFDQFLGAEAVDEYTVDLYAQRPDAEAVDDILVPVFPQEIADLPLGDWTPLEGNDPVGTGPWEFETYEEASFVSVSSNDNYWLDDKGIDALPWWDGPEGFPTSPPIDNLELEIVPEDSSRAGALQNGEIDITYRLPADQKTNFDEADGFRVPTEYGGGYLFASYPVAVEPFDNKNVRKAINQLIPRTDIVENITNGWSTEAWTPLPRMAAAKGTTDYDDLLDSTREQNERDLDEADGLLEEADVDLPIEVTWVTNSDDDERVTKAETIVESLNQSDNINADLETPADLNSLFVTMSQPEWHLEGKVGMIGLSGTFNPHSFCQAPMHPTAFNQCCNVNIPPGSFPELIDQMDQCQFGTDVASDPDLRRERYDQLWRDIVDESPASFVDFDLQTACINEEVLKGYNMYPFITGLLSYGLWAPVDEQVSYIDR